MLFHAKCCERAVEKRFQPHFEFSYHNVTEVKFEDAELIDVAAPSVTFTVKVIGYGFTALIREVTMSAVIASIVKTGDRFDYTFNLVVVIGDETITLQPDKWEESYFVIELLLHALKDEMFTNSYLFPVQSGLAAVGVVHSDIVHSGTITNEADVASKDSTGYSLVGVIIHGKQVKRLTSQQLGSNNIEDVKGRVNEISGL
eukprot:GHVS01108754.1.p1 GENE.GHVS01108754.1~~GHVS01108754.1.p1  ORF type:complete len:201 (+),score=22.88 GHVS01108754.1:140-742(+)